MTASRNLMVSSDKFKDHFASLSPQIRGEPYPKLYISAKEDSAEKSDRLAEELEKATREAAGL